MASLLPPFPRFVFTIFEPLSLIAGYLTALFSTNSFIADQYPSAISSVTLKTPNAQVLALQLGNTYGLLALLGLFILNTTTEVKVVKAYVIALLIADVGHVSSTMVVMGWDMATDVAGWNIMAWGNIGITVFLFVVRTAYLAGWFGEKAKGKINKRTKTG